MNEACLPFGRPCDLHSHAQLQGVSMAAVDYRAVHSQSGCWMGPKMEPWGLFLSFHQFTAVSLFLDHMAVSKGMHFTVVNRYGFLKTAFIKIAPAECLSREIKRDRKSVV